jgi:hypothetical protein
MRLTLLKIRDILHQLPCFTATECVNSEKDCSIVPLSRTKAICEPLPMDYVGDLFQLNCLALIIRK